MIFHSVHSRSIQTNISMQSNSHISLVQQQSNQQQHQQYHTISVTTYTPLLQLNYEDEELLQMAMRQVHSYPTQLSQPQYQYSNSFVEEHGQQSTTTTRQHNHQQQLQTQGNYQRQNQQQFKYSISNHFHVHSSDRTRSNSAPELLIHKTMKRKQVQIAAKKKVVVVPEQEEQPWVWHEENSKNTLVPVRNIYKKKQRPYDRMMSMLSVLK
jgi:hypothetical protein